MSARTVCYLLAGMLAITALAGCRATPAPAAKLTWVEVDITPGSSHPAARRLRELSMAVGEERSKGVRPLMVGELSVLLDQIIRDGAGRPLAYVSIGVGGVPSEARSYSARPGSREDGTAARGVFVSIEVVPVPGSKTEYIINRDDMGGSADGWSGGRSGSKVDLRRDVGRVFGGGHGSGTNSEYLRVFAVEPVKPERGDLYYKPDDVLPGRAE